MGISKTLRGITRHPLTRHHRAAALWRFLRWQIASRLSPGAVAVPFVESARLLMLPGMTGATGNLYMGLHEFEDMAFVLHVLRPDDLFVDVGANVGSYTILAGKVVGSRCISAEPVLGTYRHLVDNINLNAIGDRVRAVNTAVGRERGRLRMTVDRGAGNRIASSADDDLATAEVAVTSLDELIGEESPAVIKIDVEGFESEVLAGASRTLAQKALQAVLMETNRCARLYGGDEADNHEEMLRLGFTACRYDPESRTLSDLSGSYNPVANTIYVRDVEHVQGRLRQGREFSVLGQRI